MTTTKKAKKTNQEIVLENFKEIIKAASEFKEKHYNFTKANLKLVSSPIRLILISQTSEMQGIVNTLMALEDLLDENEDFIHQTEQKKTTNFKVRRK